MDQQHLTNPTDDLKAQPGWAANPSEAPQGDFIARTLLNTNLPIRAMQRDKSTAGRSPRSLAAAMRRVSEAN